MRDLEGSYFCFADQSMAALVWLRAAMLCQSQVWIHLHTSHSILLLFWNWRRRIELAHPVNDWKGEPYSEFEIDIDVEYHF